MRIFQILLFALATYIPATTSATARNRAILIGVSNYEFAEVTKLKAPGNDVRLMYDMLRERDFAHEDIAVLADALDGGRETPASIGRPSAKAILDALDALARTAGSGDFVVVYFSGHGSYARQDRQPGEIIEPTGWNQVLLAVDASARDRVTDQIKGAIPDKVLKTKFDAIRAKAFLWLVLDACHSGGFTRDESTGGAVHYVAPSVLDKASKPPPTLPANQWVPAAVGGKQVAFLAAPETHPAYEKEIGEGGKSYSLFTHTLVTSLRAERFSSYRRLATTLRKRQSADAPPPVFEGDLDLPLFDGNADGPRDWFARYDPTARDFVVEAGALHGLHAGAELAVKQANGRAIGFVEVKSVTAAQSRATLTSDTGHLAPRPADLSGDLLANVARPTVPFRLRVARPPAARANAKANERVAQAAVAFLADRVGDDLPILWLAAGTRNADLHLRILDDVIYFVPSTGVLVRRGWGVTPSVAIGAGAEATAGRLKDNLWRELRQRNLLRIAGEMRESTLTRAVDVSAFLLRDPAELARVRGNEKLACTSWSKATDSVPRIRLPADGTAPITLTHCDRVQLEITNRWHRPIDVTLLYMDAEAGIGRLPKDGEVRINPGEAHLARRFAPVGIWTWCDPVISKDCPSKTANFQPLGNERLIVIIADVEPNQEMRTFQYLEQPSLESARRAPKPPATRGTDSLDRLLRQAGLGGPSTRGDVDTAGDATIRTIPWTVVPPSQLKR
jgi:Caspase domain